MDGDSLSYLDMMERSIQEERRRERERQIMDEGKQLWQLKKQEQLETEIKDQEEVGHIMRPVPKGGASGSTVSPPSSKGSECASTCQ